jgi:two-component sensor histidine kinase
VTHPHGMNRNTCPTERLLLTEIAHRVNNELSAAIAIASIEIARAPSQEMKTPLARIKRALEGFASVHQVLRVPERRTQVDACAYLRALCGAISRARLEPFGIELRYIETPLRLDSERCWRLGLIVCELVTNAARHAFSGRSGRITVEAWSADSDIKCRVSDDGGGTRCKARGLGLRIIDALLRDLNGCLEEQSIPLGATFTVSIPGAAA